MDEPNTSIAVQPNQEAFVLFDRADDQAIVARLRGQALKECVYAYRQGGQMIYGLGVDGADECKRELAKLGEVIREDDIQIVREDAEYAYFKAFASRWAVRLGPDRNLEIRLDTKVETKRQWKFTMRRDGTIEPNEFWFEQGSSKAMRNAVLGLIPAYLKQQVIDAYKDQAKPVDPPTPAQVDTMVDQYHAAFKDKDERDEKIRKLTDRWRDLNLTREQVKKILAKRNLSEGLAHPKADWSLVDLAVIQDMLTEAGA